jgi:glycosyltransferase involved in cell wall biosynthesis
MPVAHLMQRAFRAFRRRLEYRRRGLEYRIALSIFDADWYLKQNPDIRKSLEYRIALSVFDADWYLKQNPDIRKSGIDPAEHYLRAGRLEGRIPGPNFRPNSFGARWLWRYVGGNAVVTRSGARLDSDWEFLKKTLTDAATSRAETKTKIRLLHEAEASAPAERAQPDVAEMAVAVETLNIVFINHGPYDNNSALHIAGFANALGSLGHHVVVSAAGLPAAADIGLPHFHCVPHQVLCAAPTRLAEYFADDGRPDIVHCWTPRPIVQSVAEAVVAHYKCPYIVHFEDNETAVARAYASAGGKDRVPLADDQRSNSRFVEGAAGATVIVEALKRMLPPGLPCHLLEPGVDGDLFAPATDISERERIRSSLGLATDAWITIYPGNIHPANYEDMFSLYVAVHALNARGYKVHLVRTGIDGVPLTDRRFSELTHRYVINLGFVDRQRLIDILKLSDFFVQPGGPDDFNSHRLPSKLPELLAMGRPVVLPKTNIGLLMHDGIDAMLLERGDAAEITDCVETLLNDAALAARIGQAGRLFALERFNWERSAKGLGDLYQTCCRAHAKAGKSLARRTPFANNPQY